MQASALADQLAELGAEVIESATIDIQPAPAPPIDQALLGVRDGAFDWLVLTSPNGARAVFERMDAIGMDARGLAKVKIAAVGPGTAEAMRQHLIHPDLIAEQFTTESLAGSLAQRIVGESGKRVLLMRADIATPALARTLAEAGANVHDVVAYRTVRPATLPPEATEALSEGRVHWITFTSSSTVENFLAMTAGAPLDLSGIKLAAIGPVTADTMKGHGLIPTVVAQPHTIDALVNTIVEAERGPL
jgi:uroporphyrinogen III methyltransferase/synthase